MTVPSEPDPTMPVPTGGEPTQAVPPVAGGEPTIPVQGESFGGGSGGPGGTGQGFDDEGGDNRMWWIAGGLIAAGIIIAIIVILVSSGGGDDTPTTTTSSSTTTSSTTTTLPATTTAPPTTTAAGPQIQQFTVNDASVSCPSTSQITLTWSTQNAQNVTVSIDNPNGPFGNYPPTGSEPFPFACGAGPGNVEHIYYLRANGSGGQTTQSQISVTGTFPPATTSTTSD